MRKMNKSIISWILAYSLLFSNSAFAAAPDALGGSAFPLTYISTNPINLVDGFNEMLQIVSAQAVSNSGGSASNFSFTGPAPVNCGAACTLATTNAGTGLILFNLAAGGTATLPAATGTGNVYHMRVATTTTSAAIKVLTGTITDTIIGTASGFTGSTAKIFVGNASTYHSIQMPFAGSQPSGGFAGDTINCTDIGSAVWACDIQYEGGTTPTTPYSASTS